VFLEESAAGQAPLATQAIVHDVVLVQSGAPPSPELVASFARTNAAEPAPKKRRKKAKRGKASGAADDTSDDDGTTEVAPTQRGFLARLLAWLLMDEAFHGVSAEHLEFAFEAPMDVLSVVAARQFVEDSDRREELVRLTLRNLDLKPADEPAADAEDRLSSLDSMRRVRLLREARAAEDARRKREQELAAELARKRAAEQAARYDREY
jgi:hypothetical protein